MLGNVSSKDRTSWYVSPRTLDEKTKDKRKNRSESNALSSLYHRLELCADFIASISFGRAAGPENWRRRRGVDGAIL